MFTRNDLIKQLGLSRSQIDNGIKNLCEIYGLERTWFNKDQTERAPYELTKTSFELVKVMITSIRIHPLVINPRKRKNENFVQEQRNKVTIEDFKSFYYEIIHNIDRELSLPLRTEIKSHSIYLRTVKEVEGITHLTQKLAHFLTATNEIPDDMRLQLWKKLYRAMDKLIYECYDLKTSVTEEYEQQLENIERKYKSHIRNVKMHDALYHEKSMKEEIITAQERKKLEIHHLKKEFHQRLSIRSLDSLLIEKLKEELFKHHHKSKMIVKESIDVIGENRKRARISPYDQNKIEEELYIDQLKEKEDTFRETYSMQIKRVTGYTVDQLEEKLYQNRETNIQNQVNKIKNEFLSITTTEKQVKDLLSYSKHKPASSGFDIDKLNRRNIGREIISISNQLKYLHEKIDGVLYEQLTDDERQNYLRVLEVVEQTLAGINLLQENSQVREGQMQDFYKNYLTFYQNTLKKSNQFELNAKAFVIRPAVDALDLKNREE